MDKGSVIWLTGLSGSGKTTIARSLYSSLSRTNSCCYLDGDVLRHGLCSDLSFSRKDRNESLRRSAEVAKLLLSSGVIVICAFITPFTENRVMIQEVLKNFPLHFIYLSTPLAICERRDVKGLYAKARRGDISDFTGIGSPFHPFDDAHVVLDTTAISVEQATKKILSQIEL